MMILTVSGQAESDAQEKDKQLNDLLVRMAQYEQVRPSIPVDLKSHAV